MTIDAKFINDTETEMQAVAENEYAGVISKLWWMLVAKRRTSKTKRAILNWLFAAAHLRTDEGGNMSFSEMVRQITEISPEFTQGGFKLSKSDLEDAAGAGESYDAPAEWARSITAAMAYWPQRLAARAMRMGHLTTGEEQFRAYDGKPLFATDHPLSPFDDELGTYSNLLTGANAKPIDNSVSIELALANLADVFEHIGSIRLPDDQGEFRCLRPKALLVPPKLYPRAKELCARMTAPVALSLDSPSLVPQSVSPRSRDEGPRGTFCGATRQLSKTARAILRR